MSASALARVLDRCVPKRHFGCRVWQPKPLWQPVRKMRCLVIAHKIGPADKGTVAADIAMSMQEATMYKSEFVMSSERKKFTETQHKMLPCKFFRKACLSEFSQTRLGRSFGAYVADLLQ